MLARFGKQVSKSHESVLVCRIASSNKLGHAIAPSAPSKYRLLTLANRPGPTAPKCCSRPAPANFKVLGSKSAAAPRDSASSSGARHGLRAAATLLQHRSAGGGRRSWLKSQVLQGQRSSVGPNRSFNPRLATAGSVSLLCGGFATLAHQAYTACLRSRG